LKRTAVPDIHGQRALRAGNERAAEEEGPGVIMNREDIDNASLPSDSTPQRMELPDGQSVYHVNKHETDFLYKEIFVERAYLKHGIVLPTDPCVLDVGANIGMFSLFIKQERPAATVHCFEPTPELNQIIKLNVSRFESSVRVYQCGVSDRDGEAVFTYYPNYSIMSGFHADAAGDADILSSGIRNQLASSNVKRKELPAEVIDGIVQKQLGEKREIVCQLQTLSTIIREAAIERIDLLKVDAEKSEMAILRGIQEKDWQKIRQIVLEVHSVEEVEIVIPLLERNGFSIKVEQEGQFANSGVFNCFAIRS